MNKVDEAVLLFSQGWSCSQAILSVYAEQYGLARETALKLGEGFGGGMANMGRTCGAVTGAFMVIGLAHGRTELADKQAGSKTRKLVREFTKRFEDRNRSTICKDLIGCDIDSGKKARAAAEKRLFQTVCTRVVNDAAEILEEIL